MCDDCPIELSREIQKAFIDRDLEKLKSLYSSDFWFGPDIEYLKFKKFEDVFSEEYRTEMINPNSKCEYVPGGYGYRISGTGIIFDDVGNYGIKSIGGALEPKINLKVIENKKDNWVDGSKQLLPKCFSYYWYSGDNYEYYAEHFKINNNEFDNYPGKFFGREIGTFKPIKASWGEEVSLARFTKHCSVASDGDETGQSYKLKYEIPSELCKKLAPNMNAECLSAYVVELHQGKEYKYNVELGAYGLFQLHEGNTIIPLANFNSIFDLSKMITEHKM